MVSVGVYVIGDDGSVSANDLYSQLKSINNRTTGIDQQFNRGL